MQGGDADRLTGAIARVILCLGLAFVVSLAVGKFSLIDRVKVADEAVFSGVVGALQSIPGLTSVCNVLTDLGAIPVNWGMALAMAFVVGLQRRSPQLAVLIVGTHFCALVFQWLTNRLVDGYAPVEFAVGEAGPYFSGGVMRVIILVGIAATLAEQPERRVWRLAVAFGLFEGFTRLVVGRHWPIDLLAAIPIGLTFLWAFRQLALPYLHRPLPERHRLSGII